MKDFNSSVKYFYMADGNPQQAYLRKYKAGEVIFSEGDVSASIFIVKTGAISVRKNKMNGYIEVARLKAGEVIGELSFFDRQPRSASAVAMIDMEVLEIPFENLEKIYSSIPPYMKTIMAALADRLRKANELIKTLQKKPGE